ncbi:hypothetical protein JMJ35_006726 [Cladonia borealis]|uniref:Beta-lactamase-related domain-containing protein n=1 Tax=Cladonia borealis TaxID=184061 RepID=A0AA39R057_9LECA|nr:hypothetical protein JMJ35_006726 [Cladonia borealis]
MDHDNAVFERLQTVLPVIELIRKTFQCSSVSLRVLHQVRTPLVKGFVHANQGALRAPDGNTIYCFGSCTKALTAVALGLLVESGHVDWDTRVIEYLPEFTATHSPEAGENAALRTLLSHSTGFAPLLFAMISKNGAIVPRREDVVHLCSKVPFSARLRSGWKYNNWLYALAARSIEIRSADLWQSQIHQILEALGMSRSFTTSSDDENIAHGYKVFNDGRMSEDGLPLLEGGDAIDGSALLDPASPWMKDDFETVRSPSVASVETESSQGLTTDAFLKALQTATQPQFPLAKDPRQPYGLGLFSFNLPTCEIITITNAHAPGIMNSYTIGADSSSMLAVGHTGDLGSFTNAYWTFPETESAIIVMTNASST